MAKATVRGAALEAAKKGRLLPHQLKALENLDRSLTAEQQESFTTDWRAKGDEAKGSPFEALRPLLDLIAQGEGDYNSVNRGRAGDTPGGMQGLERMTIAQVQGMQTRGQVFAVGRYQLIPETLRLAIAAAGFQGTDLFSAEVQDWLAVALLLGGKRPALRDFLVGRHVSIEAAQLELAKEWASIPKADGRGVYDGDAAGNRAKAKVATVQAALRSAREGLAGRTLPQLRLPEETILRLTQTGSRDGRGLEILRLELVENGKATAQLMVVSGAPGAQRFRLGKDSRAGSLEPLPQGQWGIADIAWAAGKDRYDGSWGPGLGPASVPLQYRGPGTTRRSAIEIHFDANHGSSPGTAGCIGLHSIDDLKALVGWLRRTNPRLLVVDWGL